jgi:hypothetical protein
LSIFPRPLLQSRRDVSSESGREQPASQKLRSNPEPKWRSASLHMSAILTLPAELDEVEVFAFLPRLWEHQDAPEITLDFSQVRFAYPFGALVLGSELQSFLLSLPAETEVMPEGIDLRQSAHSYLAHIGLFQFVGLPVGKEPGMAAGSLTYIPIRELTRNFFSVDSAKSSKPMGAAIQLECERLAAVLTQKRDLKTNRPIAYCLREVIRNVFEHAQVDECAISAQRWGDETVELAITDRGRGIRASLSDRFSSSDDGAALQQAILPGVTRAEPANGDDVWANSGFGLFVLSELGVRLGKFTLCSGSAAVQGEAGVIRDRAFSFHGTAVRLQMRRPKGVNFESYIESIISEGERRAGEAGHIHRASKSSRLT